MFCFVLGPFLPPIVQPILPKSTQNLPVMARIIHNVLKKKNPLYPENLMP